MAHEVKEGQVLVDWTSGDPESDRAVLFWAYRAFLNEVVNKVKVFINNFEHNPQDEELGGMASAGKEILDIFNRWGVGDFNVDDFPRVSITTPKDRDEEMHEFMEKYKEKVKCLH